MKKTKTARQSAAKKAKVSLAAKQTPKTKLFTAPLLAAIIAVGVLGGAALSLLFPIEMPAGSLTGNAIAGQVIDIGASNARIAEVDSELPFEAIHWHAHVSILAAGSEITMPAGIGIDVGNNTDNDITGGPASPIHTHEADNVIHVENTALRLYKEQLTIGYFFNTVWQKKFSSECILEYCNGPGGVVKMFVNGKESNEYEKYSVRDGDEIVISYDLPQKENKK